VPERYGHRQSIYHLFRRWQLDGVWTRIWITLESFADAAGLITWQVSVDSTQPGALARRRSPPPP
jgi:transposase